MSRRRSVTSSASVLWHSTLAILLMAAVAAITLAPREQTMGDAQRVLYIHVAVAWTGLVCYVLAAAAAVAYLITRNLFWDHWSQAAVEMSWLCCSLTLVTGSLWARAAWGTWWTWDPRLLTAFILWALCCGCLLVRNSVRDPHSAARLSGAVAVIGVVDVPLVVMATRWFRTIHPVAPEMEPLMRVALLVTVAAGSLLFLTILVRRRGQLRLQHLFLQFSRR